MFSAVYGLILQHITLNNVISQNVSQTCTYKKTYGIQMNYLFYQLTMPSMSLCTITFNVIWNQIRKNSIYGEWLHEIVPCVIYNIKRLHQYESKHLYPLAPISPSEKPNHPTQSSGMFLACLETTQVTRENHTSYDTQFLKRLTKMWNKTITHREVVLKKWESTWVK